MDSGAIAVAITSPCFVGQGPVTKRGFRQMQPALWRANHISALLRARGHEWLRP